MQLLQHLLIRTNHLPPVSAEIASTSICIQASVAAAYGHVCVCLTGNKLQLPQAAQRRTLTLILLPPGSKVGIIANACGFFPLTDEPRCYVSYLLQRALLEYFHLLSHLLRNPLRVVFLVLKPPALEKALLHG